MTVPESHVELPVVSSTNRFGGVDRPIGENPEFYWSTGMHVARPASRRGVQNDNLTKHLEGRLRSRASRSILRQLNLPEGRVDFSSNDYLGFARDATLQRTLVERLAKSECALGSTGSRLLDGNSSHHTELEARLATFFDAPAALLFSSGYDANVSLFSCLPREQDAIVHDSLIHASVHDGMRASRTLAQNRLAFRHNSVESMRECIQSLCAMNPSFNDGTAFVFIAVESLYSMDGDFAPLDQLVEVIEELLPLGNGHLIVDEAHTTGIAGRNGQGLVCHMKMQQKVLARLHTFGKALGSSGGAVLGSPLLKTYLINYARPLIYTTAMAHFNLQSIHASLDHLLHASYEQKISHLHYLCKIYTRGVYALSLRGGQRRLLVSDPASESVGEAPVSPIHAVITSQPRALALHLQRQASIVARPITYPTVPEGEERVRVCIHAHNTVEEVEALLQSLTRWTEDGIDKGLTDPEQTGDRETRIFEEVTGFNDALTLAKL